LDKKKMMFMSENDQKWFEVAEIADRIWAIRDKTQVASYLIEGKDKSLLIDTGWGIGNLKKLVETLTLLPVKVVFTHGHPDHVSGAYQFKDLNISPADINLLKNFYNKETRKQIIKFRFKDLTPPGFSEEQWINAKIGQVTPIQDGDIIDIGGRKLKIIATPGHTAGSICLLDEDEKMLFSGDSVQSTPVLMHLDTSLSLSTFLDSLKNLYSFKNNYTKILPSHGETPINKTVLDELLNGVSDILEGKIKGTLEKTRFGEGLICKFNTSTIIYDENRL
jgi:hydroxyacylglutathione hydrolase